MQYLLMIYSAEDAGPQPGTEAFMKMLGEYQSFNDETQNDGVYVAGEPLESINTATTVRVRNGQQEITDGPFAETKEALGGFYLLDCENLDEAIAYAAKIPTAAYGSIEIRPIMNLSD
ncbi:YciI family protein [Marinicella sediminis]|uniref:YciI family protein n=1 Tax=Marinicella sediminis TaxID=1792834 RepID=A0ABV7J9I2_9GAMM|nr:YciI family protein [Marinicella sediminis]